VPVPGFVQEAVAGQAERLKLGVLCRVEQRGPDTMMAQCPADGHDDRKASLSVAQGDVGAVVFCQAGCDTRDVLAGLGLGWDDLFDVPRNEHDRAPRRAVAEYSQLDSARELVSAAVVRAERPKGALDTERAERRALTEKLTAVSAQLVRPRIRTTPRTTARRANRR
jgi:hypothetical protein